MSAAAGSVEVVVGVDLGTTDTKALVLDLSGRELGFYRAATTWAQDTDGRSETTAEALLGDVLGAVGAAMAGAAAAAGRPVRALGLGLAGFAESGVVVDAAGQVITPVVAWFDQRGSEELAALDAAFRAELPRRTGLPVSAQWTLAKLLWMRGTGTALPPGSCWLNIPEYIAHALGGARVSEPSLASRTALVDQATGKPWPDALRLVGADPASFLPDTLPAGHAAGNVTLSGVPTELEGAAITVAGHDHSVAAAGAGAVGDDELFNSCGTADVLLRSVPRLLIDKERERLVERGIDAGRHVLRGQSALIGGVRAGLVLRRVLALLGAGDAEGRARMDRGWSPGAAHQGTASVTGAQAHADEVSVTVKDGASPDAVWAAALEHVSMATRTVLEGMNEVVGPHSAALAAGGWTRMASVRSSKRQLLPGLRFSPLEQPGAFGAALLAAWAATGSPGSFLDFAEPFRQTALQPISPPTAVREEGRSST